MSVRSPNVFLHPYYVTRLGKYFAKLVGQDTLGGPAFMEIMTPLMQEEQHQVNFEGASGYQAVRSILEHLPQRISPVVAVRAEQASRTPKRVVDRTEPRDKSPQPRGMHPLGRPPPPLLPAPREAVTVANAVALCRVGEVGRSWLSAGPARWVVAAPLASGAALSPLTVSGQVLSCASSRE